MSKKDPFGNSRFLTS